MFPHAKALVKRLTPRSFAFVGVNDDRDIEMVQRRNKKDGVNWRSFQNGPKRAISDQWNVVAWPTLRAMQVCCVPP